MRKTAFVAACLIFLACGGDDGPAGPNPAPENTSGEWVGGYGTDPHTFDRLDVSLLQDGVSLTGTLVSNAPRTGTVTGSVDGEDVSMKFTFTDSCGGQAVLSGTFVAVSPGHRIEGDFNALDCLGSYAGTFALDRR